jgi:hypothetical protein
MQESRAPSNPLLADWRKLVAGRPACAATPCRALVPPGILTLSSGTAFEDVLAELERSRKAEALS